MGIINIWLQNGEGAQSGDSYRLRSPENETLGREGEENKRMGGTWTEFFQLIDCFIHFWFRAGSLLLHTTFSSCGEQGLLSRCGAQASHHGGFCCCRAWATSSGAQGLQQLQHVGSVVVHGLSFHTACGIFPDLCPVSPALADGFPITGPQESPPWREFQSRNRISQGYKREKRNLCRGDLRTVLKFSRLKD